MTFKALWLKGEQSQRLSRLVEIRFKKKAISYWDYPVRHFQSLIPSKKGVQQLGGTTPIGFKYPNGNSEDHKRNEKVHL
jgi:hypothetical protein